MTKAPDVCATDVPKRNSPRIGRFVAKPTYFVCVEQKVLVQISSCTFIWFSSHYTFNLEYKFYKDAARIFV